MIIGALSGALFATTDSTNLMSPFTIKESAGVGAEQSPSSHAFNIGPFIDPVEGGGAGS
jgi:hypothetical protein